MSLKDRALSMAQALWDALPQGARRRVLFSTNDHFLVGVVGIVTDDRGRILLLDHRFRTPWRWGLPGGFIDRGEHLSAALVRELEEEVGLRAVVDDTIFDTELEPNAGYVSITLTGRAVDPPERIETAQRAEIVGGGFYGRDEMPEGLYPHHHRIIERYFGR